MNIVLTTAGTDWVSVARLAAPLKRAGFFVIAVCPVGALLEKTRFVDAIVRFQPPATPTALWQALRMVRERWGAAFIVPGDEAMVVHLRDFVFRRGAGGDATDRSLIADLVTSLGPPAWYNAVACRSGLGALPPLPGCLFPLQAAVVGTDDLFAAAERTGYPLYVKCDVTAGGVGVFPAPDEEALQSLVDTRDAFVRHGPRHAGFAPGRAGIVQRAVGGREASVACVAMDGELLGAFVYARTEGWPPHLGATALAAIIERPDLVAAAAALVRRFGFSGFAGIDAIIEEGTDHPYVLEFNARPTLASHLGDLCGADLCAALHARLGGRPPPPQAPVSPRLGEHRLVALFPSEWQRDSASPHLWQAYHDVPWDDPALVKAIMARFEITARGPVPFRAATGPR